MPDYRLIDLDAVRYLSRLLEGLADETHVTARTLTTLDEDGAQLIESVSRWSRFSASDLLARAAAAEPGAFTASPTLALPTDSPPTELLDCIFEANRKKAGRNSGWRSAS
jgi:hypothetical protein